MYIRIFTIPILDGKEEEEQLNQFIKAFKVITVESQFVQNGANSFWSFCVRYLQNANPNGTSFLVSNPVKKDYKQILSPECFAIFNQLRAIRKTMAQVHVVPAYAIFTDEELAQIAQLETLNVANLPQIKGIGEKKAHKYGAELLEKYEYEKSKSLDATNRADP